MLLPHPQGRKPRAHFSGIGGTGMVAAARLAIEAGWEVRGSDTPLYPPTSTMVAALSVPVATEYAAANLDWEPDVVVIGNALSRGNDEVEATLERKMHYVSMPEFVKDVVLRKRHPVVVAGTHGKTTTTALAAFLLDRAELNPGFLIGGQPLDFSFPGRIGEEGAPFVIEGDEYDTAFFDKRAKFLHYLPHIAVVTSVEFDHADIYDSVQEISIAFQRLLRQVPRTGTLVLCADSPTAMLLAEHTHCNVQTYGFDAAAAWRIEDRGHDENFHSFALHRDGAPWGEFRSPLHGRHNLQNVAAALIVGALHGLEPGPMAQCLAAFKGIRRRMEIFLSSEGIAFIDDFAHHPTAVRETIAAARSRWPDAHLTVLFEPRSNTTATNRFQNELGESFEGADEVWIGPIYRADRYAADQLLERAKLVEDIKSNGATAHFVDDTDAIVRDLRDTAEARDVVLILSNGAFGNIYDAIRAEFADLEGG